MNTRRNQAASEVAAQAEDQAATTTTETGTGTSVPDSPPGDFRPPAELTAQAERMNAEAGGPRLRR